MNNIIVGPAGSKPGPLLMKEQMDEPASDSNKDKTDCVKGGARAR
jgi:hypothetical protein